MLWSNFELAQVVRLIGESAGQSSLCCEVFAELDDLVQRIAELLDAGQWNDNGVAPTVDFFGDAKEPSARILTQIKGEVLTFHAQSLILQRGVCLQRTSECRFC